MAISIKSKDTQKAAARKIQLDVKGNSKQALNNFKDLRREAKTKYDPLNKATRDGHVANFTAWDWNASSPTVQRENTLYFAVLVLYLVVFAWLLQDK